MSVYSLQGNTRMVQALVISTVVLVFFLIFSHYGAHSFTEGTIANHVKEPEKLLHSLPSFNNNAPAPKPANATLDFQEIIYVSMPYRTDRQDAMSLTAAVSGIKLTMIPGVRPDEIHPKANPHTNADGMAGKPPVAIWRAHANVWRYIIDNNIESALILEDDVDWDFNIREVMGTMNWQLRYNNTIRWGKNNVKKGWSEDCAYGCDWDELFVGHCGGKVNEKRLDLHQTYPDPHSPPLDMLTNWSKKEITQIWNMTESDGVRVIAPTFEPLCTGGYAVTRMGAMRALYHIGGWMPFGFPVDNELAWKIGAGKLSGYTIMPPAFYPWKLGGARDSDNDENVEANGIKSKGMNGGDSQNIKNSVRKHLESYFEKNYWQDMENELRRGE